MKSTAHQRTTTIGLLACLSLLMVFIVDGCKKDDGPTGPYDPPSLPTVAGRWTGGGSYFDQGMARRLNYSWAVDFNATQADNSFSGGMTSTYTDPNIYYTGDQWICRITGVFNQPRLLTIRDTSAVFVHRGVSTPVTDPRLLTTYEGCVLSSGGDTITYSGPSPGFETFVLFKQK